MSWEIANNTSWYTERTFDLWDSIAYRWDDKEAFWDSIDSRDNWYIDNK